MLDPLLFLVFFAVEFDPLVTEDEPETLGYVLAFFFWTAESFEVLPLVDCVLLMIWIESSEAGVWLKFLSAFFIFILKSAFLFLTSDREDLSSVNRWVDWAWLSRKLFWIFIMVSSVGETCSKRSKWSPAFLPFLIYWKKLGALLLWIVSIILQNSSLCCYS